VAEQFQTDKGDGRNTEGDSPMFYWIAEQLLFEELLHGAAS